jgi:hypoxanthine phosphoribosyltransferase
LTALASAALVRVSFTLVEGKTIAMTAAPSPVAKDAHLASPAAQGVDRVLISPRRIKRRVQELGKQVSRDYTGKDLVCVGALNGVVCFMADLLREIEVPTRIEMVDLVRSVEGGVHTVRMTHPFREPLTSRDVLIVEDIVDTGVTLAMLVDAIKKESPASLRICALLDKPAHRQVQVPLDYVGFTIPPVFVVGYGLDYEGFYRNLPYVGIVDNAVWLPAELGRREA